MAFGDQKMARTKKTFLTGAEYLLVQQKASSEQLLLESQRQTHTMLTGFFSLTMIKIRLIKHLLLLQLHL